MTDEPTEAVVRVTLRDVYDEVRATRALLGDTPATVADHETRIRVVEGTVAVLEAARVNAAASQPARMSGWQIGAVIVAGLVGIASVLGVAVSLVNAITT